MRILLMLLITARLTTAAFGAVVMSHFEAYPGNNRVNFQWGTTSEVNNWFFEIFRNDSMLVQLQGQGNSSTPHEYAWADQNATNGVRFVYILYAFGTHEQDSVGGATLIPPHWVAVSDFGVSPGDQQVAVRWTTEFETNSDHFDIMRDGGLVGQMTGQFRSVLPHSYYWADNSVTNGQTYQYVLWAVDVTARRDSLASASATPLAIGDEVAGLPGEFALTAFPNPFNATTTIRFALPRQGNVILRVFDTAGRLVSEMPAGNLPAGEHRFQFSGASLPTGVYFVRIEAGTHVQTAKILLLK